MSALQRIKDYLNTHFAGHDIETLMQHFETAIESKVEEAVEAVREEIQALRDELSMGNRPAPAPAEPMPVAEPTAEIEPHSAAEVDEVGAV